MLDVDGRVGSLAGRMLLAMIKELVNNNYIHSMKFSTGFKEWRISLHEFVVCDGWHPTISDHGRKKEAG